MSTRLNRRRFLAATSAAAVSTLSAPYFLRARNANEKLNLAVIGVAWLVSRVPALKALVKSYES